MFHVGPMYIERRVSYFRWKQKMTSFMGQASMRGEASCTGIPPVVNVIKLFSFIADDEA
jgi:hypothetical protein